LEAPAFVPSPEQEYEIPGPYEWVAPLSPELMSGRDGDAALDAFQARYGGTWRMLRNEATGVASALYGSGIPLAADGVIDDAADAEALSRAFIDQNVDLIGASSAQLVLGDAVFGRNKWGISFYQAHNGIRIERSKVTLVFHASGRLYAILSDTYSTDGLGAASVSEHAAVTTAKSGLGFQANRDAELGVSMSIVPLLENGKAVLHVAYKVDLETDAPRGRWSTYVDAAAGDVIARRNNVLSFAPGMPVTVATAVVSGTVSGTVPDFNPCDGNIDRAFRNQRVKEASIVNGTATDTLTGAYAITVADSTPRLLAFNLIGRNPVNFFRVNNQNGPSAAETLLTDPSSPISFYWDDSNSRKDERAAWVHGNRAHDFVKNVDPTFTGMDFQVGMNVNYSPGQSNCPANASWDGANCNFCAASGANANTGEIGDVIYHEYGHGVNSGVYAGFGFDFTMSEGQADMLANFVNEDPVIGDGFFSNCGVGIRSSSNNFTTTSGLSSGHEEGQVIAGFWWELRGRLIETHSALAKSASPENQGKHLSAELWHWCRRLTKPADMAAMVLGTFVVDDDNGNLSDGTPNYQDICDIALRKGFTCPSITQGVSIVHAGLESTTDTTSARVVTATITSLPSGGVMPSSVELKYRVNGGSFTTVGMTDLGSDTYSASIPAMPQPSVVEYYLVAMDSAGSRGLSPTAAEDATPDTSATATPTTYPRYHAYDVCKVYDACEAVGSWTLHAPGSTAVGGVWQHGSPVGSGSQPGYDATPGSGVNCFGTGVSSGNVNNGITILLSPVWNLSGSDSVVAKMRRWFSNDLDNGVGEFRQDYLFIDASNDSGQTWTTVEATNEGVSSWQERSWNLSTLFGPVGNVQFRFTAQDTGAVTVVEALVDEIRISTKAVNPLTDVSGGADSQGLPARFALHANVPNPFNPLTVIRYDLPKASAVDLAVFNASGQRVRTLVAERVAAGSHATAWNGRNDRGDAVGSGVYFYRLTTPEHVETRKMMLVK
jgi:Zn-dependent metalloprotease